MEASTEFRGSRQTAGNLGAAPFDAAQFHRLCSGAPDAEEHFATHFGRLLTIMLRKRLRSYDLVEDVRQETLTRVLVAVRRGEIRSPGSFGCFVIGVCHRVLRERVRDECRYLSGGCEPPEAVDHHLDAQEILLNREARRWALEVLSRMAPRDREILRLVYADEANRDEICRQLGITRECLRVTLHRAKCRLREAARHDNGRNHGCWW